MDELEHAYLQRRMEEEDRRAKSASCPSAAAAHRELSRLYLRRLSSENRKKPIMALFTQTA